MQPLPATILILAIVVIGLVFWHYNSDRIVSNAYSKMQAKNTNVAPPPMGSSYILRGNNTPINVDGSLADDAGSTGAGSMSGDSEGFSLIPGAQNFNWSLDLTR